MVDGEVTCCSAAPAELSGAAHRAATKAIADRTAVVAVGGDGTLNTVAQAAHAAGCAMGVVAQGTFNYFARTHGIPTDPTEAVSLLLRAAPAPVQVASINDRVFLVNASLGLYPDLLDDREAYKARFGRSRWVAFVAACATLLRAQRRLRLHIEMGGTVRDVQTLTLFVGNNRLQLQQFGVEPEDTLAGTPGHGSMAALMLRPIGTLSMIGLMLHGAMGRLGEAAGWRASSSSTWWCGPRSLPAAQRSWWRSTVRWHACARPSTFVCWTSPCTCSRPLEQRAWQMRQKFRHECPAANLRHPLWHRTAACGRGPGHPGSPAAAGCGGAVG